MSSKFVPVTIEVKGDLKNNLPVLLTGAEVIILDDKTAIGQLRSGKAKAVPVVVPVAKGQTKADGKITFNLPRPKDRDLYFAVARFYANDVFGGAEIVIDPHDDDVYVTLKLDLEDKFEIYIAEPNTPYEELTAESKALPYAKNTKFKLRWSDDAAFAGIQPAFLVSRGRITPGATNFGDGSGFVASEFYLSSDHDGPFNIVAGFGGEPPRGFSYANDGTWSGIISPPEPSIIQGGVNVTMQRTGSLGFPDLSFWPKIRRRTDSLLFKNYFDFMEWIFCNDPLNIPTNPINTNRLLGPGGTLSRTRRRMLPFTDTDAYRNIKAATEAFVMANCGFVGDVNDYTQFDADFITAQVSVPTNIGDLSTWLGEYLDNEFLANPGLLPYLAVIRRKMMDQRDKPTDIGDVELDPFNFSEAVNSCYGVLRTRLTQPCLLELIWSYWQEEGMLVQSMNAIGRRFQNVRAPMGNDPLANFEVDPLRPLNNVLWGYIQDEQHRLSVVRRNYEYDHHYGLRLSGKAVNNVRTADSRSKFLEAFHMLLSIASRFYRLDDDTTVKADAFPVLNALKEAHLILSQGAHNQFGDLPSTARIEMLMQQWILGRPEFREFLPTRIMVAYPEPWMDRVDAMKKLQNWSDTSVLHFRNLAIFGEQVLLSIRFGNWADVNEPLRALNWARYWRSDIEGYIHAYRSVTGIDLSVDVSSARVDATMPSVHLVRRLEEQRRTA